ncbi:BREX-1 system phosphatase PglZ type A [Shewanella xiamenensis]|uniref:BREX-1 system phosphatase PglZ type A n=1 Tax=Shewanella xiamenensis TaxID=332186 RepID=UPI00217DEED2|nr:BREX-1 system phosphatase PglZ type A [Shewanella xiamenensis]MCT8857499.1 BREX-1 system phosphatase PglZ type A [Shewanella xiamenensis]UWG66483.1 BREX-1 system phosphatase PglZ type A [Shewanella xiamenensis]
MQISELAQGVAAKLEQSRIVFWYDPEQSFTEELEHLANALSIAKKVGDSAADITARVLPNDLTILNMGNESVLAVKKRIEVDEREAKFLIYFPSAEPEPDRDWLLDVRLYSEQFFADHSSMLLNELGIPKMALRTHVRKRQSFFANKQRITGLKKWVTENEDELSLDRKMMAVVVKADSASLSDILLGLLRAYSDALDAPAAGADGSYEDESLGQPDAFKQVWSQLSKFDLETSLWAYLSEGFGYTVEEPTFSDFVLKLFCTEFWSQIEGVERDWLLNNVLKSASGRATALAFMVSWRDSRSFAAYYESISKVLSQQLEISTRAGQYHPVELIECETFEAVEQAIIRGLVRDLLDSSKALDRVQFDTVLSRRLASHWTLSRKEYFAIYEAIRNAEELMHLRNRYVDGFNFDNAKAMYDAYTTDIYRFDQAYRLFNEHVHSVLSKGADILRQLDDEVESIYTNWYLYELGLAWDRHLANEKLLEKWQISGVPHQYDFYEKEVRTRLSLKQTKRVFVIISDALRFEIANELGAIINNEKRFKAEVSTQLGVLPSYTQLGMAALLPHKALSYQPEQGTAVHVDGISSQGLDNRNSILQKVGGMAVSSKELMSWSNQEGRDKVRDVEVVYIYHDTIDAIGDKAATEEKTFEACRSAIEELKDLVGRVINRLNGSRVVITADHGFLFQQKALVAADKTSLKTKPAGAIEAKKRYIVGNNLPSDEACWKGSINDTAHGSSDTEFLLPKAAQRFHFVGGAKFVHGGAMLQEVCVPVLHVRELQKEQAAKHEKQPVGVVAATQPIKLVNNIDKVRFIQTDPVGERFVARLLDVYIVDAQGNEVSSRETINFDSVSKVMDERTREARLKLIGSQFDRNAQYTLVLENAEMRTRYSQYAVTIDLAFQDDFF